MAKFGANGPSFPTADQEPLRAADLSERLARLNQGGRSAEVALKVVDSPRRGREEAGDAVALSNTLNTQSASLQVQALVAPANGEVTLTLTETDQPPPAGVLDLSPVFSVESDEALPPMALQVPLTSKQWLFPFKGSGVYYSTDSERFTLIADSSMNAGFMQATLPGAGFFFVGGVAAEADRGSL